MKKAKEYVKEFEANQTVETVLSILRSFLTEVQDLARIRQSTSNSTVLAILDEQDAKWRSLARRTTDLTISINPRGFELYIMKHMYTVYQLWKKKGLGKENH